MIENWSFNFLPILVVMKKHLALPLVCIALAMLAACIPPKQPVTNYDVTKAYTVTDVSYGSSSEQKMDMYMPANRSAATTKVFVLIHGGGWSGGSKADFTDQLNTLKTLYPAYGIINLNYRLGTSANPGFPKQIDDIRSALIEAQKEKYALGNQYMLIGASAGAHLSMLYAYAYDPAHEVKAVCNTVGPADLSDSAYINNLYYQAIFAALIGNAAYTKDSATLVAVSPAKQVTAQSPPTISFYGNADPLVPSNQMTLLHNALDAHGVYNEKTMYNGGHGGWSATDNTDAVNKIVNFINARF
jgi:acetyl esterase/lipase